MKRPSGPRRAVVALLAAAGLLLTRDAAAQQPTPAAIHVAGVITDAQTDFAIRRARVTVEAVSTPGSSVLTDEKGLFSLDLQGDATLTIAKAGYARETVKVARPRGAEPVELHVAMKRGAAITGRVVDASGVPVLAANVSARIVSSAGQTTTLRSAQTDDFGEFRFGGLPEGEVQVAARSASPAGLGARNPRVLADQAAVAAATSAVTPVHVRPGDSVDIGELTVEANQVLVSSTPVDVAGAAVVTGQVKDSRGRPMRVPVRLTRSGSIPRTTASDVQGRFRFEHVPAGSYIAEASRPGAPTVQFGQRYVGQPGSPIDVREGATVNNIDFALTGGTAITGTITDEYGEPVEGAFVRALQIRRISDRLAAVSAPGVQTRASDDRGAYRLFGLLPGRYLVVADVDALASLDPSVKNGYAPIYYSGAAKVADALPVSLDKGDAIGIDLAFHREPTTRVTGTALDSRGQPVPAGVLLSVSQRSGGMMLEPKTTRAAADGSFAFENVPSGDYAVQTIPSIGGASPRPEPGRPAPQPDMEFGMQYVTITDGQPPPPILLRTTPGATLHGRISEDGNTLELPQSLTVYPAPADFDLTSVIGRGSAGLTKKDDGTFDITGITGPQRFVVMSPVEGWYLKEVRVRGSDALDTPYDFGQKAAEFNDIYVVVSPRAATISGTVTRAGGAAETRYAVVLFSTNADKWYRASQSLRMERPSQTGEFRISRLPPGAYYALAVNDGSDLITSEGWQDPTVLDGLRTSATRITLGEGENRSVTLRLTSDR